MISERRTLQNKSGEIYGQKKVEKVEKVEKFESGEFFVKSGEIYIYDIYDITYEFTNIWYHSLTMISQFIHDILCDVIDVYHMMLLYITCDVMYDVTVWYHNYVIS